MKSNAISPIYTLGLLQNWAEPFARHLWMMPGTLLYGCDDFSFWPYSFSIQMVLFSSRDITIVSFGD
jgi:hypothetical protein